MGGRVEKNKKVPISARPIEMMSSLPSQSEDNPKGPDDLNVRKAIAAWQRRQELAAASEVVAADPSDHNAPPTPWQPISAPTEPISLTCWREFSPDDIRARFSEILAFVVPLTILEQSNDQALVSRALSAPGGEGGASFGLFAFRIAMKIVGREAGNSSIGLIWMALAGTSNLLDLNVKKFIGLSMFYALRLSSSDLRSFQVQHGAAIALAESVSRRWLGRLRPRSSIVSREPLESLHALTKHAEKAIEAAEQEDREDMTGEAPWAISPIKPSMASHVVLAGGVSDDVRRRQDGTVNTLSKPLALINGPDPDALFSVLAAEFPWANETVRTLLSDYRLRRSCGLPWFWMRPTLLVGPPGCGKTRLAKRLAELTGLGFCEMPVAGSSDNRSLAGTSHGWSSATPSLMARFIAQTGCPNPLVLVDELDKAGGNERNGDIRQTLLGLTEPVTARRWMDEGLDASLDLSCVSWIATANDTARLRGPLLSRFRVIHIDQPTVDHFDTVYHSILRGIAAGLQVGVDHLPSIEPEAINALRRAFGKGWPIRKLVAAMEAAIAAAGEVMGGVGMRLN